MEAGPFAGALDILVAEDTRCLCFKGVGRLSTVGLLGATRCGASVFTPRC